MPYEPSEDPSNLPVDLMGPLYTPLDPFGPVMPYESSEDLLNVAVELMGHPERLS